MAGSIRIVAWNANGLVQRNLELELFLVNQRIDICLIAETHFTKETIMRLRGYKSITLHTYPTSAEEAQQ